MTDFLGDILHSGNILNNSYLHCKYLRKRGILAESLNVDYTHCQGQPEWTEVKLTDTVADWDADLSQYISGFRRPLWYHQALMNDLPHISNIFSDTERRRGLNKTQTTKQLYYDKARNVLKDGIESLRASRSLSFLQNRGFSKLLPSFNEPDVPVPPSNPLSKFELSLPEMFRSYYPDREDQLTLQDIRDWQPRSKLQAPIMQHFRMVQGYALDPIVPLLGTPGKPFICYEHGTLRDYPYEDSARGRLYSLSLQLAEKVIITNSDCYRSAQNLNLKNYTFIPHLIDDEKFYPRKTSLRDFLEERFGCDFIVVAPARHHWKHCPPGQEGSWFKGNDVLIQGLANAIKARPDRKILTIFFEWGQEVDLSKELIRECGIEENVHWEPIRTKPVMADYINAADIVLDQFKTKARTFGAVAPEAMACAKPVILDFNEDFHHWCYPEMPPIINANDAKEIESHLLKIIDSPDLQRKIGEAGLAWFREHHSSDLVISRMIDLYNEIWDKKGWPSLSTRIN